MVADHGAGRVFSVVAKPVLRYNIAAGAVEVLTGLPAGATVTSLPALQEVLARTDPKSLHLAAFHPTTSSGDNTDDS